MYLELLPFALHVCITSLTSSAVCEADTCDLNEVCQETEVGYMCLCDTGYERDNQDICSESAFSSHTILAIDTKCSIGTYIRGYKIYMYIRNMTRSGKRYLPRNY